MRISKYLAFLTFLLSFIAIAPRAFSLSLKEAYRNAIRNNEEVNVSRETQLQAQSSVTTAKSRLYPEISVSGNLTRQKELTVPPNNVFQPEENNQYQFELNHRLYYGGKTWFGWSLRSKQAEEESLQHYRRLQEILFRVARRYYEALLAERNFEISQNTLQRSKNQLERANGRYEVGEVTQTSVLRAEVSVSQSKQSLTSAENELDIAYQRLGLAMGYDTAPESIESIDFTKFQKKEIKDYYQKAVRNRKDLQAASVGKEAAKERVKWERADFYPSINVVSQFSESEEPRFSDETQNWNVQLVGSYPLFSGWRESAEVDRAQSQYRAAQSQYKRIKDEVRVNIRNIYLDLQSQKEVIETVRNEVESAKKNYEQISAEFEEGLVTAVEVNDALQALEESQNRLANARYNYQLSQIRLSVATGTFKNELLKRIVAK